MSVEIRRLVLSERVFGFRFFTAVLLVSLVLLVLPAYALVYWRADYNDLPAANLETPPVSSEPVSLELTTPLVGIWPVKMV